jgi:hypothetical protein
MVKHNDDQNAEEINLKMNTSNHPCDISCIKERLF